MQALDGVDLDVPAGGIVGLIGPNGAGKTTLFNCVSGLVRPDRGSVRYRADDMTRWPPHRRAAAGIGRTFQNVGLCKTETVLTNLLIAQHSRPRSESLAQRADELLELLDIGAHRHALVQDLPVGIAKLVELACVLSADPALLLLDEPSSGLGPEESDELRDVLLRVKSERDLSILMIGHDMRLVMSTAEHIYVLSFGRVIAEGPPDVVQRDPDVVAAYLGSEAGAEAKRPPRRPLRARRTTR